MATIESRQRCGLYRAGHNPHWIAMKLTIAEDAVAPQPAKMLKVGCDGRLVIEVGEHELTFWNHQPGRLVEMISANGPAIEFQLHFNLFWLPSDRGRYAFCVARSPARVEACRAS